MKYKYGLIFGEAILNDALIWMKFESSWLNKMCLLKILKYYLFICCTGM